MLQRLKENTIVSKRSVGLSSGVLLPKASETLPEATTEHPHWNIQEGFCRQKHHHRNTP
jgi:hypothetical protein